MKILSFSLIVGLTFCACNHTDAQQDAVIEITKTDSSTETSDIAEIEALVREMYVWHDKGNPSSVGTIENDDHTQHIAFNLSDID